MATAIIPSTNSDIEISADNPFAVASTQKSGVMESVMNTAELGRIQAKMFLAKQFPRDQARAYERIKVACGRPELASNAIYEYSRGGTKISGPSIRLAEEIVRCWTNIDCGFEILEQTTTYSDVRVYAIDYENNIGKDMKIRVYHFRDTKQSRTLLKTDRDIYEQVANMASRRIRNCILYLIPADVTEMAVQTCEQTMLARCDMSPENIRKLVQAFETYGVTQAQIEAKIQRKIDAISPGQVVQFKKIYTSLKDGMSNPSDWFDMSLTSPDNDVESAPKNKQAEELKARLRKETVPPPALPAEPAQPKVSQAKEVVEVVEDKQQPQKETQPKSQAESQFYTTSMQTIATTKIPARLQGMIANIESARTSGTISDQQATELLQAIDDRLESILKGVIDGKEAINKGETRPWQRIEQRDAEEPSEWQWRSCTKQSEL